MNDTLILLLILLAGSIILIESAFENYPIVEKLLGTIPRSGGCNNPQRAFEFVSKTCFGVSYL